jgi:hypothetical protein
MKMLQVITYLFANSNGIFISFGEFFQFSAKNSRFAPQNSKISGLMRVKQLDMGCKRNDYNTRVCKC